MIAAISLIVVVFITLTINRIATLALTHTGLSRETAMFQARSAFTGSGFTTTETEQVMNHPVRRRIIFSLMLIGNAGLVTVVSSLVLAFALPKNIHSMLLSVIIVAGGLLGLLWLTQSQMVERMISYIVDSALGRYTDIDVRDYAAILHLSGEYQISDLHINPDDWIANKTLGECKLWEEGILVLGIQRKDGNYMGTPEGSTEIVPGDVLTLYGRASFFKALDERRKGRQGDEKHEEAVIQHQENIKKEQREDGQGPQ
jgi:hypothetical protein